MFSQMVLHLKGLVANRALERAQVQVLHFDMAIPHALQGVGFTAVAVVDFACEWGTGEGQGGGGGRHGRR